MCLTGNGLVTEFIYFVGTLSAVAFDIIFSCCSILESAYTARNIP